MNLDVAEQNLLLTILNKGTFQMDAAGAKSFVSLVDKANAAYGPTTAAGGEAYFGPDTLRKI